MPFWCLGISAFLGTGSALLAAVNVEEDVPPAAVVVDVGGPPIGNEPLNGRHDVPTAASKLVGERCDRGVATIGAAVAVAMEQQVDANPLLTAWLRNLVHDLVWTDREPC